MDCVDYVVCVVAGESPAASDFDLEANVCLWCYRLSGGIPNAGESSATTFDPKAACKSALHDLLRDRMLGLIGRDFSLVL